MGMAWHADVRQQRKARAKPAVGARDFHLTHGPATNVHTYMRIVMVCVDECSTLMLCSPK